jgi:selenium-binding protein 1
MTKHRLHLPAALAAVAALAFAVAVAPAEAAPKPKATDAYMYVWAGADGRKAPDRLITLGYDEKNKQTYGKLIAQTLIPPPNATGNEPHHCGISHDRLTLICGGLLSAVKGQDWLFFFDLGDPANPTFVKSMKSTLAAYPDDFIALHDNTFLLTEMGSMTGGSPGRVAKIDANGDIVGEYPANPPSEFNPHGVAARTDLNELVTCDYIDPASTLNTTPGAAVVRSSVRVWDLNSLTITKTINLPNGAASMDCKLLNKDPAGRGYVGGSGNGHLYLFDPQSGTAKDVYNVRKAAPGALTQYMQISADDKRLYVPYFSDAGLIIKSGLLSGLAVFDITNPEKPVLIQNLFLPLFAGPHMSMLDGNRYIVTDYLLDEDGIGKIHYNGDHYVRVFKVASSGKLTPDCSFQVDFDHLVSGVRLRPHGMALSSMM